MIANARHIAKKYIPKLPKLISSSIKYHAAGRLYTPKPTILTLGITLRCNAKCVMCSIWKKRPDKELSLDMIRDILRSSALDKIETVIFSGGEPTLREDLPQMVDVTLRTKPRVKDIWLITNGLNPELLKKHVAEILGYLGQRKRTTFGIELSLDGYADTHDTIRGIPRAFHKVSETLHILKSYQRTHPFDLHIHCVVQQLNVDDLQNLSAFTADLDVPMSYVPVIQSLGNREMFKTHLFPTPDQMKRLRDFFSHTDLHRIRLADAVFWEAFFNIVAGGKRKLPCVVLHHALSIAPDGTLFICGNEMLSYGNLHDAPIDSIWFSKEAKALRKMAKNHICPTCAASCNISRSLRLDLSYITFFLLRRALTKAFHGNE